jgi:CO/xanthine dehydrogenase Mo-binding subunit
MPSHSSRIDGLPKVLGEKVYARDMRASDLAGWPPDTHHALLVRAGVADRSVTFDSGAVNRLPTPPLRTVTAADLAAEVIRPATEKGSFASSWFVPDGDTPEHAAQPVALLIFDSPRALRDAQEWMGIEGNSLLRFGQSSGTTKEQDIRRLLDPLIAFRQRDPAKAYDSVHYVRIAGNKEDVFSHIKNGRHDPTAVGPEVTNPSVRKVNRCAMKARDLIERTVAKAGWKVIDRNYSTQTTDPMFMEPEAGLGWWDRKRKELHLVVGTQSPKDDRADTAYIFNQSGCPLHDVQVKLKACYPGGGFGGRDKSSFPLYLAIAAAFSEGPVRLSFDRYEQFLCGIKRHACAVQAKLAYDEAGTPQALQTTFHMDGGGEANLTVAVVGLAALHAAGPYRIPRTAISARGIRTTGAPAGSMRGFGIPQAAFAIECLMDEVAGNRGDDPIEYRMKHSLRQGDRDVTGMVLDHHLANVRLCEIASKEPLWVNRKLEKATRDREGLISYGVGFACCMEAYGTSEDAILCEVLLQSDGSILVRSSSVDMGQGSATSIAVETASILGRAADQVMMGESEAFEFLKMEVGRPESNPANPKLTPKLVNSSSASVTAFHHLHAVDEACQVVFDHGILPAAKALWGNLPPETSWKNGALIAKGHEPLSLAALAEKAHASGFVVGAMVHTYFKNEFATCSFDIGGKKVKRAIDALAITSGGSADRTIKDRLEAVFPPASVKDYRRTLYASAGHLVAVQVHLPTGRVKVLNAVTILDAGDVHHEALLAGQVEGGFAMGLGYALLEDLPPAPLGIDGSWNLHRYQVPRAKHIPLDNLALRLVPLEQDAVIAGGPLLRKKGIAEATMTTVAPAIVNAVAHATGVRINSLPVTPAKILESLRVS